MAFSLEFLGNYILEYNFTNLQILLDRHVACVDIDTKHCPSAPGTDLVVTTSVGFC
jgi:hypothetical protein